MHKIYYAAFEKLVIRIARSNDKRRCVGTARVIKQRRRTIRQIEEFEFARNRKLEIGGKKKKLFRADYFGGRTVF